MKSTVSISGASQGNVGVNWQITESPSGSNASIVGETSTFADSEIISSAYLKLGSLPGSYTTEARCSECTSGSPQKFTATAVCPEVKPYYQGDYSGPYDNWCKIIDPKTKKVTNKGTDCLCQQFDNSNPPKVINEGDCRSVKGSLKPNYVHYSIAAKGCALTSISIVLGRYGSDVPPDLLNTFLNDTSGGYIGGGVNWRTSLGVLNTNLIDVKGYYGDYNLRKILSKSLMDVYLAKCMPIIVQVFNKNSGNLHWVVVTGKVNGDYAINDPAGNYDLLSGYGDIYQIRIYLNSGGCQ